jgi:hypothetical protein
MMRGLTLLFFLVSVAQFSRGQDNTGQLKGSPPLCRQRFAKS